MKVGENAVVRPKMVVKIMPFIMNGYTEVYLVISVYSPSVDAALTHDTNWHLDF